MTATPDGADPTPHQGPAVEPRIARRRVTPAVHELCPYLRAESGRWRSAYAAREHRCGAVDPAARLTIAKQRSLCLLPAHETCSTYTAAQAIGMESNTAAPQDGDAALWPAVRSVPVVLEPTRGLLTPLAGGPARTGGQALLVGLMALAFLVLVVARTTAPHPPATGSGAPLASVGTVAGGTTASPGESPGAVASWTPAPSASSGPSSPPSPTPAPSGTPPVTPSPTPAPAGQHYTVKSGDTLGQIATRFNTTVQAIAAANNIADPRLIRIGQVLIIP